ncbi:MAG: HRDC domain-containing protein [Lachnospiraceae bacterium]|nr:HRDC domain-containing protein [Lachnospiraceae bacterium]
MTDTPKNKQELLDVFGFGNVKVEKYGDMIIEIINRE